MSESESIAFVAGATGYTGRAVVEALRARGVRTVAHIRPDSPDKARWTARWQELGAEVDDTPWEAEALARTLQARSPTLVFALLGTTRRRAKDEGRGAVEAYEAIDYGLTMMLLEATKTCPGPPRLVYLSSMGLRENTRNPYMAVRVRVEKALREGDVPYTIARPSVISGTDRDQTRPAERIAAGVLDRVLNVGAWFGARKLRERYRSTRNVELAEGLVRVALDPRYAGRVVEAEELRAPQPGSSRA